MKRRYIIITTLIVFVALVFLWNKKTNDRSSGIVNINTNIINSQKTILTNKNESFTSISTFTVEQRIEKGERNQLTAEQLKIVCEFKKLGSLVPHQGKVQVHAAKFSPPYSGNLIWIKSPECPKDKFSILFFSVDGHISKEISCLDTTLTELMRFSGEQGDVEKTLPRNYSVDLAIVSGGYFVLRCPNKKLLITREGKFIKSADNHFLNNDKCILLNEEGNPLTGTTILPTRGCSSENECVATYDPGRDSIEGLQYKNSFSFIADSGILPSQSITKIGPKELRPHFLRDALEMVKVPARGATGVTWDDYHPIVNFNELSCPD